jgi:hypothetical protein
MARIAQSLCSCVDAFGFVLIVLWLFMCCCTNACIPVKKLSVDERELRQAHAWRIACPVLASMYCSGMLHPDSRGCISWRHLWCALRAIGCTRCLSPSRFSRSPSQAPPLACCVRLTVHADHAGPSARRVNALFQAAGIAAYRHGDPNQLVRARGGVFRYLNIFRMGVGELSSQTHVHVQHGASTTIRDSRFDPPSDFSPGGRLCDTMQSTPEAAAHILESRSARFDEWITDAPGVITTSSGERRMYLPGGLAQLLTNTTACGDESGEWSQPAIIAKKPSVAKMGHTQELHEWQAVFAMTAMCVAFGETDSEGQPYMSLAALRSLYLQSELPSGWAPRPWGFFNGVRMVARLSEMPKPVTMLRSMAASVTAAPSPTPKVAEVGEKSSADAPSTPLPLSFSLAVKRSVIEVPGASATDWEIRVAMRMKSLLSELGFFAGPPDTAPIPYDAI